MGINKDYEELHKVVKQAYDKGIIIIAAAGNGQYDEALYPAKYDEVIGVGAINKDGDLLFKNLGLEDIIVLSPGKNIITTYSSKDSEEKYKGIKAYVE